MSLKDFYPIAVAAVLGCASASATSDTAGMGVVRNNPKLLTAEDIAAAHADVATAYDAIARLRPNWLASHGPMSSDPQSSSFAAVFVDGQLYGGISSLRNIEAYHVDYMRYYDVTEAGAKFGIKAGIGGAIEVTSRIR
jgi:hypothetical protein